VTDLRNGEHGGGNRERIQIFLQIDFSRSKVSIVKNTFKVIIRVTEVKRRIDTYLQSSLQSQAAPTKKMFTLCVC
jgi:hypothetical protein